MDRIDQIRARDPEFSIIVAVHNDWSMLDTCLGSLASQIAPPFEVVVVDDGSANPAPDSIRSWGQHFPLTILRDTHRGVSVARNTGIRSSRAPLLLFVDADSRVQPSCLTELAASAAASLSEDFFQLRLIGDCSTENGRAENLRLSMLQEHTIQPDGHIRYLNTAAFAARRKALNVKVGLFSSLAIRGEDTLLLVELIQRGQLPLFVPKAVVQHSVPLSFFACLRKDIRSGYLQSGTYARISKSGVRVRLTNKARLRMLKASWQAAGQKSIGRTAWFRLLVRQLLERTVSLASRLLRIYPTMKKGDSPSQDANRAL